MGMHSGKYDLARCSKAVYLLAPGTSIPIENQFYGVKQPSGSLQEPAKKSVIVSANNTSFGPGASEILEAVREFWSRMVTDPSTIGELIHDDYSGWFHLAETPETKQLAAEWIARAAARDTELCAIYPVSVTVVDNVGVIHYYYQWIYRTSEGSTVTQHREYGSYTDVYYLSEDQKWLRLVDRGGPNSED